MDVEDPLVRVPQGCHHADSLTLQPQKTRRADRTPLPKDLEDAIRRLVASGHPSYASVDHAIRAAVKGYLWSAHRESFFDRPAGSASSCTCISTSRSYEP